MRSGMRADQRPERVILRAELRPKWSDLRFARVYFSLEMVEFGPDKADLGPFGADFGHQRANFESEPADFEPERAEFWA